MGFIFQRRKKVKGANVNVSKTGASVSRKAGPITVSSRGRGTARIAKGLSFRFKL